MFVCVCILYMKRISLVKFFLTPAFSIICYGNTIFDLHPLSQEHN